MKYEIAANICRVCLIKKKKLRSLYKPTDVDEVPPNIMIEKVTGIHVEEMEDLPMLPKSICKNCELSLSMAYEFRVKILKSKRIIDLYLSNLVVNDTKQQKQQRQEQQKEDNERFRFKQIKENVTNNVANQKKSTVKIEQRDVQEFIELQQFDVDILDGENFDSNPDPDGDAVSINANTNVDADSEAGVDLLHTNIMNGTGTYRVIKEENEINDTDNNEHLHEICKTEANRSGKVQNVAGACFPEADTLESAVEEEEEVEAEQDGEEGNYYNINNTDDNDVEKMTESAMQEDEMDEIFEEHLEMEKLSQTTESTEYQQCQANLQETIEISEDEYDNKSATTKTTVRGRKRAKSKGKKNATVKSEFRHICDICGNVYAKRGRMMEHRQRHDKELKYSCELCDKKFHMRELLRKHMYSHNGGKPIKCDYCSRTFYYESVRKAHENVHKGLRPYVCDVCGKSFCYGHTLKKHKLIHAEIKLYRCDYCNKNFRLQHHMKQHELTKLHKNAVLMSKGQCDTTIIDKSFLPNDKSDNKHHHMDGIYTKAIYMYK